MGTYNRKISRKRYRARLAQRRRDGEIARALLKSHSQSEASCAERARGWPASTTSTVTIARRSMCCAAMRCARRRTGAAGSRAGRRRSASSISCASASRAIACPRISSRSGLPTSSRRFRRQDHRARSGLTTPRRRRAGPRRWYLIAAQGGSLYKQEAHPYLSKQECHHFLTAPDEIGSLRQAMWYAVARAQSDGKDAALKVARSKIADYSIASSWWKEVARFFARNPTAVHEIDDLVDFLFVAKQEDGSLHAQGPHARDAAPAHGGLAPRAAQQPVDRRRRLGRQPPARRRLRDRQGASPRDLAVPADQDRPRAVPRGPAHAPLRGGLQVRLRCEATSRSGR